MNKKIGIVGEDPNDTDSLKNLLLQKYSKNVSFIQLLSNLRGHQLDTPKARQALEIEFGKKKPDILIV